ncbi:DUF3575 domain-containing protein [Winogradskyella aurantia]|uniref:Outer membrane protein beta-barrel domain-containing protein n=1 Tax=Winogradskyella aurantia TaxID=1915063 RepID=A0A265UXB3_9FLAO|nr:DUF3575 domain-containing protein [Winogradskyella aurantia]OZV69950.1 hypothetical protein CA834_04850 [Winogradskyella aurantia]
MKAKILFFLLVTSSLVFSQELEDNQKTRANEVGLEVLGLIDGQALITYERSFGKHWSGLIGAGPIAEEGLVNISGIDREQLKTGDINYSGYKALIEGRYYINEFINQRAIGFYVGLYAKFSGYNSDLVGTYIDSEGGNYNFLFETELNVRSLGLMVGYKLPLSKRFAIDFLIAGPGAGNYNLSFQNKSDPLPDEFFEDLNEALENFNIFDLIDGDFDFNRNKRKSAFDTVSFRYAVSLKFNF